MPAWRQRGSPAPAAACACSSAAARSPSASFRRASPTCSARCRRAPAWGGSATAPLVRRPPRQGRARGDGLRPGRHIADQRQRLPGGRSARVRGSALAGTGAEGWPDGRGLDACARHAAPQALPGPAQAFEARAARRLRQGARGGAYPAAAAHRLRARINAAGVEQHACVLCGDCCAGCNVGAKTTTALTYLPAAARDGAEIFTRVRGALGDEREGRQVAPQHRHAPRKRLGDPLGRHGKRRRAGRGHAGLDRNPAQIPKRRAGAVGAPRTRFTTNGDALANAYNNDRPVNSVGVGYPAKAHTEPVGPAVAGLVDLRRTEKLEDGLALVEASIPSGAAALLPRCSPWADR